MVLGVLKTATQLQGSFKDGFWHVFYYHKFPLDPYYTIIYSNYGLNTAQCAIAMVIMLCVISDDGIIQYPYKCFLAANKCLLLLVHYILPHIPEVNKHIPWVNYFTYQINKSLSRSIKPLD